MWVETPQEALVVPPQRAVWLPPGVEHGIRVVSDLQMRNIYLRPALAATLDSQVQVIEVGGLLRELIVALVEQGDQGDQAYYEAVVGLALLELQRARRSPIRIALPVGADRRLMSACQAVMASPSWTFPSSSTPKPPAPACAPWPGCSRTAWAWALPSGAARCSWPPPWPS